MNDLTTFLLKQMQKGKAAEKHATKLRKQMKHLGMIIDRPDASSEISLTGKDLSNLFQLWRMEGIRDWILIELYCSVKRDLGIDLASESLGEAREEKAGKYSSFSISHKPEKPHDCNNFRRATWTFEGKKGTTRKTVCRKCGKDLTKPEKPLFKKTAKNQNKKSHIKAELNKPKPLTKDQIAAWNRLRRTFRRIRKEERK